MLELKDTDLMPIGQYKNRPMNKVPAQWLLGFGDAPFITEYPAVQDYIERNRKALELEVIEDRLARGENPDD